jgi:hypothetical protein
MLLVISCIVGFGILAIYTLIELIVMSLKPIFSKEQLAEIELGVKSLIDISNYAEPHYEWQQMREIRLGLENNIDITKYNDPFKYDYKQMKQIRLGLEEGLDVSYYLDESLSSTAMNSIRSYMNGNTVIIR